MGIFAQTASSAFGCFCNTIEGSHWAFHFSPILFVAGALVNVWRSALALVALQAVAGALTIPAIYGIAARHTDRRTARFTAAVVWLYPPLAGAIFNDFHENGLAPAAIAWLLWAFDGGYVLWTIVFALIALSVKEDQALFVAIAGAIGALAYRRDAVRARLAAGIAIAAAAVFAIYFAVIQPHAVAAHAWAPTRFYAWTAHDWKALFPGGVLARLGFFVLAFLPLLFVPFRTAAVLCAIAPLGEVLASRMSTTYTMGSHYAGAWAGWVFYAFAVGVAAIWRQSPGRAYRTLYWCIALCVLEFAVANPLHPKFFLHAYRSQDAALDRFLRTLPPGVSIATQEEAYSHLAAVDDAATLLPETAQGTVSACYLLTDSDFPDSPRLQEAGPLVKRLARTGIYTVVRSEGGITLYKRRDGCR